MYIKLYTLLYSHHLQKTVAIPERKSGGRKAETRLAAQPCPIYTHSAIHIKLSFRHNARIHVSFVYIKLYEFCFHCVYNTIRVSERMPGRIRGVFRNGRLGACILCILSYTRFIMVVYIMLYIYGLYKARKGVYTRLCILRHTHLYVVGLSCV